MWLKILFFVLLLVSIVEVWYYFFFLNKQQQSTKGFSYAVAPNSTLFTTDTRPSSAIHKLPTEDVFIQLQELFKRSKPDILRSAWVTFEYEGTIKDISLTKDSSTKLYKELKIKIEGYDGNIQEITVNDYGLQNIAKFVKKEGSGFKNITVQDFKRGDKIILKYEQDLLADWNYGTYSISFTKLQ